jgi:diapolycopene oxygenase
VGQRTGGTHDVGVVGGGLGGLSAACTLAARGYSVVLFERNAWLGGKAAQLAEGGFRFDMGPTILTVPSVLRRVLGEADRRLEETIELVRLDPQWRCFFDDGSRLDLAEFVPDMARALETFAPGAGLGDGYGEFIDKSRTLDEIADAYFFWRPVSTMRQALKSADRSLLRRIADVRQMRLLSTVAGTVRTYLRDARAAQMADHFTQYVGSSPYKAPAVLCGIAHMQIDEGVWYPVGGTRAVPAALEGLARELGVDVRPNTMVRRIFADEGGVSGVETDGDATVSLAAVVCNMDVVRAHRELLRGRAADAFASRRSYEPACSGVVLYLGLDRRYEHLAHHCFVFSRDAEEEFEAIYERGEPAPDPTCYLCAPAGTEPAVAPPGGEALYVLVHTPYLRPEHDWTAMLPAYRERILSKLERAAGLEDIREHIVFESALTPAGIHSRYSVLDGAIYGLASHGRLGGAFKPSNRSPDVRGLYFAGGSAHPGPGMPMALMSGWIAADALDGDGVVDH